MSRKKYFSDPPVHTFTFALVDGRQVNISIYSSDDGDLEKCFIVDDFRNIRGSSVRCRFGVRRQVEKLIKRYMKRNRIPVSHLLREEHYIGFYVPCREGKCRLITEFFSTDKEDLVKVNCFVFRAGGGSVFINSESLSSNIKSHSSMLLYADRFWSAFDVSPYLAS